MEKSKEKSQYTFAPEEKEILEILALFEQELGEKLQESKGEVERIKYYEKFQINKIDFCNIFVTTEKDVDGNISYHMYCGDSSNEIISIDSEGKIKTIPELEAFIGDLDIEDIMEKNEKQKGRLKGISEKMEPEEIKKSLKAKGEEEKQQNGEEQEDEQTQEIEEDLEEQGQDLDIGKYREIKDNQLAKRIPEAFKQGEENGVAFSHKLNKFVIISKVNGQYQINEKIQPSKPTWKTIISIDENGEKIERKVPNSLMKIENNKDKEIALTIGQYGDIDIETVQVLPCQERIARGVRMQGEGMEKEESYQLRQEFEKKGKAYPHDLAHQVEEIEEHKNDAGIKEQEITEQDYIPNTQMTWGELMDETGESLPALVERYNREMTKEGADSEETVETIKSDYKNVSHEHDRK